MSLIKPISGEQIVTRQNQNANLQQINENVTNLTAALVASERRNALLARAMRWGALAFIVLIAAVAYVASDLVKVYASQANWWNQAGQQISTTPPKLDDVLESLMGSQQIQAALVKILQSATQISMVETPTYLSCVKNRGEDTSKQQLCFAKAAVEDLGEYFLDENGKLPQPPNTNDPMDPENQKYMQRLMEGAFMAAGQVVADTAVLVHRLRRDSDFFRGTVNKIGGTNEMLNNIRHELRMINATLGAVPAMANEMNAMNRQMSVMSYSVGSTMGRMGSIIPW